MNKPEQYFSISSNQGEDRKAWFVGSTVIRDNEGESLAHTVTGTGAGLGVSGHWRRGYEHRPAGELGKQVMRRK